MSAKMPPVPPEQRSPKGPGGSPGTEEARSPEETARERDRNPREQGRQGNVKQNTTNTGYQQDR